MLNVEHRNVDYGMWKTGLPHMNMNRIGVKMKYERGFIEVIVRDGLQYDGKNKSVRLEAKDLQFD